MPADEQSSVEKHDRAVVGAGVVAPLVEAVDVAAEKRPGLFGVGVKRTLLVVVYLLLAWPMLLPDSATFPSDIPEGLTLAALTLAVLAAISLGWRRWRWSHHGRSGHKPTYRVSLTSIPVVLLAFVLAGGASANRAAEAQHQRHNLAASDAVSTTPLERDRGAFAAWMTNFPAATMEEALALRNVRLVRAEESRSHPSLAKLTTYFAAAQTHARRYLAAIEAQPAATSAVKAIKTLHQQEATALVAATTDYVRGLHPVDQKLLDAGDMVFARFQRDLRRAGSQGDALYHRLGGYAAFKNRLDFEAYAEQLLAATKAAKP
jgi:hypothetical protein